MDNLKQGIAQDNSAANGLVTENSENLTTRAGENIANSPGERVKAKMSPQQREKIEKNKELREKLLQQMEEEKKETFSDFSVEQRTNAGSKKKTIIVIATFFIILAVGAIVVYNSIFARTDIMRGMWLGESFEDVKNAESKKYDSKEPESYGDVLLTYKDVKYEDLRGDMFYYFSNVKGDLDCIDMKFTYSDETYDYILKKLSSEYGDYKVEFYSIYYQEAPTFSKNDIQIHVNVSESKDYIDVVIEKELDEE